MIAVRATRLVTQAHGDEPFKAQALYLAWSTAAWRAVGPEPLELHLYPDDPGFFRSIASDVVLHPVTASQMTEWKGPRSFVYRM